MNFYKKILKAGKLLLTFLILSLIAVGLASTFSNFNYSSSKSSNLFSFSDTTDIDSDAEESDAEDLESIDEADTETVVPPIFNDTTLTLFEDTTGYIFVDSSARVEHFVYRRKDPIYANAFSKRPHPFFLENRSTAYQLKVELDSTGSYVDVTETIYGKDLKIPIRYTLDEYIHRRLEFERYKNWEALTKVYKEKEKEAGLGDLFGTVTNIDIPVPSVPFLSIFGPPKINIRISGAVNIKAGFRRQKSDQATIAYQDQVRNEPNFNQEVQVNVNGMIGDKLNINADWNTQRTFEYENQLKIKYTGYEDEIIQTIEAGNVSLQTPASYIGSSQALFGIKGKFQLGPLTLQTVMSQKKGQTRELTASGGAQEREFTIRAFDYSTNHFFLDTLYRSIFEVSKSNLNPQLPISMSQFKVVEIEVWKTRQGAVYQTGQKDAVAIVDLPPILAQGAYSDSLRQLYSISGIVERGTWIKLQPNEYKLNDQAGYISLNTSLQNDQALAVAFRCQGPTGAIEDDILFGEFAGFDTSSRPLILKLIRPRNLVPSHKYAWNLMLKNIYSLGGSNLKQPGFELKIYREEGAQTDQDNLYGIPLIRILGLDRFGENSSQQPDDKFDYIPGLTIDESRAEIIFPTLEPFRKSIRDFLLSIGQSESAADSLTYPEIYDTLRTFAQQSVRNKYILKGKVSTERQNKYMLGFNVVEGSVQVLLDGSPLTPNVDYTVDYMIGEVIIRSQRALMPGANLQIKYEQNDLFQLASKTLIGARGEIDPLPNTKLGFTFMNLNQETLSDKVRLNEEPTNNSIFGIDASTSLNLDFLTKAIDALPLIRTQEMSTIRFSGEAAYMLPDPNTKKSTIQSDKGAGIAYIDDFEGARRSIPLGVGYSIWRLASPPAYTFLGEVTDIEKTNSKARLWWYNRIPSDVLGTDIWPKKYFRIGQEQITVLNLDYFPKNRGQYNYSMDIEKTLLAEPAKNWAGIMRYLGAAGANIIEQNINYIELWLKTEPIDVTKPPDLKKGRIFIDLGKISEDIIPNKKLNSEDLVKSTIPNGVLNPGEDVGLDMLTDAEEREVYKDLVAKYPEFSEDPSGDNFAYTTGGRDFSRINGTERNELSPEGRFPDTEDLNNNGELDILNSYLEYEIPLDTVYNDSTGIERINEYIVGGGNYGWYQFRIPLTEFTRKVSQGNESATDILQNMQYVRVWISGFDEPIRVRIADISLVGNQWQEVNKADTVLKVAVINIEDNPEYDRPPGVLRERDRTQPDQEIYGNEQSLRLIIKGLQDGQSREAFKFYSYKPLDVFNYRTMKMFVHGDQDFVFNSLDDYDAEIYLRFGIDSLNYYEYRAPIHPGWDPSKNEIIIKFSELTAIKEGRDSVRNRSVPVPVPDGPLGAVYVVRGNPSLTNIKYIWVGVENPIGKGKTVLYGEVWINELRVSDVDDTPGWAYKFDSQLKIADFGNVSFNYSQMDPYFHGLDTRFGGRKTLNNWAVGASFSLDKFLPSSWQGTSIPFNYNHSESIEDPLYLPNTDINVRQAGERIKETALSNGIPLEEAEKLKNDLINEAQTIRMTESFGVPNLRIVFPSSAWYVTETVNKITWNFGYNRSIERNPLIVQRINWNWNGRTGYAVSLPSNLYFSPFKKIFNGVWLLDDYKDYKIYFVPITNFNTGLGVQRGQGRETPRIQTTSQRPVSRSFSANRNLNFGWRISEGGLVNLSGDYGINVESSLLHLETDSVGNQRPFSLILRDIFRTNKIINLGIIARYSQRVSVNTKPKIPNIFDINKYLDLSAGYSVNYGWSDNFQPNDIGKGSGWDNNINLTFNFRLKSLTDPWFAFKDAPVAPQQVPPRAQPRTIERTDSVATSDSTKKVEGEETKPTKKVNILNQLKTISKILIKYPLLDYETININFTQTNRSMNNGVRGHTGMMNFWGIPPFEEPKLEYGPSRLYQLGILSDPSGKLEYSSSSRFPFIKFNVIKGLRAPNAQISDQFSQNNRLTLRTNRPLWEGATIDLNWNLGWSFNKNITSITDAEGVPTVNSVAIGGNLERSFFTMPPILLFKMLKSNLQEVGKLYNSRRNDASDKAPDDVKLAESFEQGMEALPLFQKLFSSFLPRANYSIRWDGVERVIGVEKLISRLSFNHAYTSSFTKQWRGNPTGGIRTEGERVNYNFAPLIGLDATMREFLKGNMTFTFKFNKSAAYDLNMAARSIVEQSNTEVSFSLTYNRRGFEFPLFGLSLSNDLEASLNYSLNHTSRTTYEVNLLEVDPDGTPLEGNTRTIIEPRIRYVLSSRITAAIYYRYTSIKPDEGGSLIPGVTTNEGGLDLRIAIQ